MNIQTLSIVVPTKGCVNHCPFCVSRMHEKDYGYSFDKFQMTKRLKWAIMNGINTVILTGTGEALQNYKFLSNLAELFKEMSHPFPNVELQTTGVLLQKECDPRFLVSKTNPIYPSIDLLQDLGVNTISLSVANIFSDKLNNEIIHINEKLELNLRDLIKFLRKFNFNIRLSLNMLKDYDDYGTVQIFSKCKELGTDQITFRKMWYDPNESPLTPESEWVRDNACNPDVITHISFYVRTYGKFLYTLPFGGQVYSVNGMSVVVDDDCMSKENNNSLKYAILRENGKLYAQWDDEGSLIF